jgi:predicted nuclease of predicted toxin-antitoxin system
MTKNILAKTLFILIMTALALNLLIINSEFFVMLFNTWEGVNFNLKKTLFLSFSYSLATLYIMIFFKSDSKAWTYIIRIIFPLIDGFIVFVFFNVNISDFKPIMSFAYGFFTFLILFFVSETGIKHFKSVISPGNKDNTDELINENKRLREQLQSQSKDFDLVRKYLILGIEKQVAKLRMKKLNPDKNEEINKIKSIIHENN